MSPKPRFIPSCLRKQVLAPDEIEQTQVVGDASHQLMEDARKYDVGVEDGARRIWLAHSGGAPIASRSRDHSAASSRPRSRRSSQASTAERGIFQYSGKLPSASPSSR
jgi:hypothetical protein